MERARVVKEELCEQNVRFLAVYVESANSCLVMLSENQDRLGTLAIAVPKPSELLGPVSSSIILGDRNTVSARMFAEYVAMKKGKIAMVSVYLDKLNESQAHDFFLNLVKKVTKTEGGKEGLKT